MGRNVPRRAAALAGAAAKQLFLTAAAAALLYRLGKWLPYSGDGAYVEQMAEMDWVVLMHSALTTLVHKLAFTLLQPLGWSAWDSVSVSSSIGGAIALRYLFAIRRNPLFLAINLLSGSFLVFVGQVENYAWVNAFLLGSFYHLEGFLAGRSPLWPAMACLFAACLFHLLALFYLPAFFWVMRNHRDFSPAEFAIPFFLFLLGFMGFNFGFEREGLDMDYTRLVPIGSIIRKGQHFTLFSAAHWEILAFFHHRAAFLGVPVEIPALIWFRKAIDTPFKRFLAICSVTGLVWSTFWHPDLGRLDWDLFSQPYIPIHVLLGILLSEKYGRRHWTSRREFCDNDNRSHE